MKKFKNNFIDIRYGMVAPKIYIKLLGHLVVMWWGWNNGKFECRLD